MKATAPEIQTLLDETDALLASLTPIRHEADDDSNDCLYLSASEIADDLGL